LVVAGAGLAVAAVVMGMVPFVRDGIRGGSTAGGPGMDLGTGPMTLPPADVPGAAQKPAAVGTDPSVLHFDVDVTGMLATGATWSVADGVESVRLWTADFDHYNHEYRLATDPTRLGSQPLPDAGQAAAGTRPVSVGGRPATARFWPDDRSSNKKPDVPTWSVDWQPVDGLWASVRLFTTDVNEAVRAAEAMDLARPQRCVAPLRLDPSPTGYKHVGCGVDFGHIFAWALSDITVERPDGVRFDLSIGHLSIGDKPFVPNRMVGSRPAMLTTEGGLTIVYVPITKEINLVVRPYKPAEYAPGRGATVSGTTFIQGPAGITDDELLAFAAAITVGPNLADPDTWPEHPLG
jgi:hypothetical protein